MTAPADGTVGLDDFFSDRDMVLEDQLNAAGVGDLVGRGEKKSFRDLARQFTAPLRDGGEYLTERDPKKIFKAIDDKVLRQKRPSDNRAEEGKHYVALRNGAQFSFLEKSEDRSVIKQSFLPGMEGGQAPVPNKMDDLCKKIINQMVVDDFLPNPKPDGDTDKDRGAADITKKFLRSDSTASGTNDRMMIREVLNINIAQKSAFAYVWVDETGGGWRPKQVKAHPQATDANRPLFGQRIDPATNKPMIGPDGVAVLEKAATPVMRYVAETEGEPNPITGEPTVTREFTNDPARAARLWLPKIKRETVYPNQVRMVPQNATAFDAHEIIVIFYESLGKAKRRLPILREMGKDQLKKLATWKPKQWKRILPEVLWPKGSDEGQADGPHDDTIIWWYQSFQRIGDEYVDGADVAVSGAEGGILLKRDTLREDVKKDDGTLVPVLMDPPITQFIALQDTDNGDPFGLAPMAAFAPGNETYAQVWMGMLEAMDRALHLNVMIPSTSPITRAEWNRRNGTPLEIFTKDDIPQFEQPPVLANFVPTMLEAIELQLNSAAGLSETANGLDSKYSISGVAKEVSLKTARQQLAQYWQNTVNGLTYFWRIKTQLAQAKLTVPQQVKLSGEESSYKQPWWVGSDLCGVTEIALQAGSGTMMAAADKAQWLSFLQERNWLDADTAAELARASMTDDLGLPPNIHEERANRSIASWADGPPTGWIDTYTAWKQAEDAKAQYLEQSQAALQQLVATGIDPTMAQQQVQMSMPAPQLPEVPAPWTPFEPRPNDEIQDVAMIHFKRFNRMASSAEYGKHPKEWQSMFDQKFTQTMQFAGVKTLRQQAEEQQAAAQAQAQAAGAAKQQEVDAAGQAEQVKAQSEDAKRQADAEEQEKARAHELEVQARENVTKEQVEADRNASRARQPAATKR